MYKVILVDDERMIREGISKLIRWEELGLQFLGADEDAESACRRIARTPPDIVITDIKMPGLDGIQFIEKLSQEMPHIRIVVLSGYGEFAFASKAMQYGVKHYLLKPCDETEISEVLSQVVNELKTQHSNDHLYHRALPKLKEQFLRDSLQNHIYSDQEWERYRRFFDLDDDSIRLILLECPDAFDDMHTFALSNIMKEIIGESTVLASTVFGRRFTTLIRDEDCSETISKCVMVQETFRQYYKIQLSYRITEADELERIPELFQQAQLADIARPQYSPVIGNMIEHIKRHLSGEYLTLNWLASEVLYMNAAYLGKLFKKETSEFFHQYVTRLRIKKAKELLNSTVEYKVYEIAEQSGFGPNPQYFSQVFKKFTGYTPKEFQGKMQADGCSEQRL